ncbi:hypothetical protein CEXT_718801 [Caerostris extrusa]|uniref:Uncharacterized protein n=1 Tax=Caerostris extrusa TaxID=172846 RepID=A0AAV4PTW1_CAEEX|nr:hypothetical protein CEXT_718801 [Caerostris extrusa]
MFPFLVFPFPLSERTHLIFVLEFLFHEAQSPEFPGELESREDGVLAGEGDEGWRSQCPVRVDTGSRMSKTVLAAGLDTLRATAPNLVRSRDADVQRRRPLSQWTTGPRGS